MQVQSLWWDKGQGNTLQRDWNQDMEPVPDWNQDKEPVPGWNQDKELGLG